MANFKKKKKKKKKNQARKGQNDMVKVYQGNREARKSMTPTRKASLETIV